MKPSGQLRVVGGQYRGRRLAVPDGQDVRPSTDRIRESLFNILEHLTIKNHDGSVLRGARVLDRFAGTGALGLEALSRGAAEAWFIERSRPTQAFIKKNYTNVTGSQKITHNVRIGDESILEPGDTRLRPFDIIFCDPPYNFPHWSELVGGFGTNNIAHVGTLLVTESDGRDELPNFSHSWETLKERQIGRTRIKVLIKVSDGISP